MEVITKLKEQHQEMLEKFDNIDQIEQPEDKKEGIKKLIEIVVEHLKIEDDEIYPTLLNSGVPESVRLAKVMISLMQSYVSDFIKATDVILANEGAISSHAISEYNDIIIDIRNRIKIEETLLFPEYIKVTEMAAKTNNLNQTL